VNQTDVGFISGTTVQDVSKNASRNQACFSFSFDFEIGWGDVTNPLWRAREAAGDYRRLRLVLPRMLTIMDDLELHATWAAVGAMFDEPHERDFSHLPDTAQKHVAALLNDGQDQSHDGRDLFDLVCSTRVEHAIASHTYAHIPFTFTGMSSKAVEGDMARFHAALARQGLTTDRFVFPENREAFYDTVWATGIRKARVKAPVLHDNRLRYLVSALTSAPPLSQDQTDPSGLVRQTGSMLFADHNKRWRTPFVTRRANRGLKRAIAEQGRLHVWAHPFNFAQSSALLNGFERFMRKVADERDRGRLTVELM